jgi:hypothetical protein
MGMKTVNGQQVFETDETVRMALMTAAVEQAIKRSMQERDVEVEEILIPFNGMIVARVMVDRKKYLVHVEVKMEPPAQKWGGKDD